MNKDFSQIASDESIEKTKAALEENNMSVIVVDNALQAKEEALKLIPKGAEVLTMTSVTLETIGVVPEINESGEFDAVRPKLNSMDREKDASRMQKLGGGPDYTIGSVHAITEDGKVIIASNTGSQLGAYAYGAKHVVWVAGAQKIVKDLNEGMKRIDEYSLPLESKRARKAYGLPDTFNSNVRKLLIVNNEGTPGRVTLILIKESLGF